MFVTIHLALLSSSNQMTPPAAAAGTVVIWRMQPLQGDAACDPTDSHVIMRHIPHMCDVKDVW